jgi:hypothetical protein
MPITVQFSIDEVTVLQLCLANYEIAIENRRQSSRTPSRRLRTLAEIAKHLPAIRAKLDTATDAPA